MRSTKALIAVNASRSGAPKFSRRCAVRRIVRSLGKSAGGAGFEAATSSSEFDHRVSRNEDLLPRNVLSRQVLRGGRCGRAVKGRGYGDRTAVKFLGEGRVKAWRAQPGLDMHEGDLAVERRNRRRIGGCRVALGQNAIRPDLAEIFVQAANELAGENRRRATVASVRDGEVRTEAEFGKGAVEEVALLAGRYDPNGRPFGFAQAADDGGHLDDFRPGTNHKDKSADRCRLVEMLSARVMHALLSKTIASSPTTRNTNRNPVPSSLPGRHD